MIHRNEMKMCMRDFHTQHQRADPHASGCFFECVGDFLCGVMDRGKIGFWKFVQFVDLNFWHHECVTELYGSDIKKRKRVLVLIDLVARNLSRDDAGEDGGHGEGGKEIERKLRK